MVDPSTDSLVFPRVIDDTIRTNFLTCPHYFFRRDVQGLTASEETKSVHLVFGGAVAHGLEHARRAFFAGASSPDAIAHGVAQAIRHWGDYEPPETTRRSHKTLENVVCCVTDYFGRFDLETDDIQIANIEGKPGVEFSFALPIPNSRHPTTGEPILYAGRFDLLGITDTGMHVGVDDKTAGYLGDTWPEQWKLRGQFTGYAWGAREYGHRLGQFRVRGIKPTATVTEFAEAIVTRPDWQIEQWLAQLRDDVTRMCEAWEILTSPGQQISHGHPFAQRFSPACHSYNRPCQFLDLCNTPDPDQWISNYRVDRWNPLTRGEE